LKAVVIKGSKIDKKEYKKFYKKVDYLTKQYKPRNRNIKAQDGTLLMEESQIMERVFSW
jgi:DNA-binding ferritin-like protein (Dps family)